MTLEIRALWRDYAGRSTIHGVSRLTDSNVCIRICWSCVVLCMLLSLGIAVYFQLVDYYTFPTSVLTQQSATTLEDFPMITICPPDDIALNDRDDPTYTRSGLIYYICPPDVYFNECYLSEEPAKHRIVSCNWGIGSPGVNCNKYINKTVSFNSICWTLDAQKLILEATGGTSAGEITLDSTILDFITEYSLTGKNENDGLLGVQVILHNRGEPPFGEEDAIFVPLHHLCRINFIKVEKKSLPLPYISLFGGYCLETESPGFVNPLKHYNVYTRKTCEAECLIKLVKSRCGCRFHRFPGIDLPICEFDKIIPCVRGVRQDFSLLKRDCNCRMPCKTVEYESTVTCYEFYKGDTFGKFIADVEIKQKGRLKTEVIQNTVYTQTGVLGVIGGLIGLFMGFSLVSMLECFEVVLHAMTMVCRRHRRTDVAERTDAKTPDKHTSDQSQI